MADQRDDTSNDSEHQRTAGQQSHRSEYGGQAGEQRETVADQGREGSFGGESSGRPADEGDGMSGQPIGGNDSNTGSGTTLTAGYEPPSPARSERDSDKDLGRGTTSNAGAPSLGSSQTSGGSSGVSGGEGFIGSSASDAGDYVQDQGRATDVTDDSSSRAKGSDVLREGRGAPDRDAEDEDAS
jgi:hypothetical protein